MSESSIDTIRKHAVLIENPAEAVPGEIFELIGAADFVLLGEASHGTHEFYEYRAEITKKLIREKNFSAVAVEADFPDAYRVNRFARGAGSRDETALEALGDFRRFPLWMWRNRSVLKFVEWLKKHNENLDDTKRVGFYGIDLYSLHASVEAVLKYLDKTDPEAARRARYRYACFDHHGENPQHYGYAASFDLSKSCQAEVVSQLSELRGRAFDYLNRDGFNARDEYFYAEQNARLVKNAEEYYREMFDRRISAWNLRDRHMAETLTALAGHLEKQNAPPKIVVWAHNSHIGDARATEMSRRGEWNVGQLIREKFGEKACSLGFTTYTGTVTAADKWDEPGLSKKVNEGLENSFERLFHETEIPGFFLNLKNSDIKEALEKPLLERAIGVIYRPETERQSHYFQAYLPEQFDGVIHFDRTRALEPIEGAAAAMPFSNEDPPGTIPEGL